jgi:hypothetical protein
VPIKSVRPMKPRSCSKEHATHKPIRAIVPIGRAIIRGIVKVAIRAVRRDSNVYDNL